MSGTSPLRYYDSFNCKLEEFINELQVAFPEVSDLRILKTSFVFAKTMNMYMPQKVFHAHVVERFSRQILDRDEGFFLRYDYRDVIAGAQGALSSSADAAQSHSFGHVDIVGQLKSLWKDMSQANKEAVWRYLSVLVFLSNKCVGN